MLLINVNNYKRLRFGEILDRFTQICEDLWRISEILRDLSKIVDFKDLVKIYYNLYEISASVGPLVP